MSLVPDFASYSIPSHLSSNMTIEQAGLLLQWLTTCLKSWTIHSRVKSCFFRILKETPWLPTERHGRRLPSSCFEKSSFKAFFKSADLPFVDPSLVDFRATLADLGVISNYERGCYAVLNYMSEISTDTKQITLATSLATWSRLLGSTHSCKLSPTCGEPMANFPMKLNIFVPDAASNSSSYAWQESQSCVLHRENGFFDSENLTILEDLYPRSLLPFFEVLQVPRHATVETYCQQWLKWRSDGHKITVQQCTRVWKILSGKRKNCDAKVWEDFVATAWVPSKSQLVNGEVQLRSPRTCFIPDDLELSSLFWTKVPGAQFVLYPDQKMECALNQVYAELGVKKLTECVHEEIIIGKILDDRISKVKRGF
ncbi:unnamed protein product [Calypogeia fissa]